jgi:hypothetical protein
VRESVCMRERVWARERVCVFVVYVREKGGDIVSGDLCAHTHTHTHTHTHL